MGRYLLLLSFALLYTSCNRKSEIIFTNDWDEDVHFFAENIKDKHVDPFTILSEDEFDKDISRIRSDIEELSGAEILFELQKIISKIGDSHTSLDLRLNMKNIPLTIQWFDDGTYLTALPPNQVEHLGKKILGINGIPIESVIDSFRTIIPYENESTFKFFFDNYFRVFEFHQFFGFTDSNNDIIFDLENADSFTLNKNSNSFTSIIPQSTPPFLKNRNLEYWFSEDLKDDLFYIQYNACRERIDLSFEDFTNQIEDFIDDNSNINKLVLDLRLNTGGNSGIAKPLIDLLKDYVDDGRFENSQIFVILSRRTFSSAVLNAIELKDKISPVFVGETAGGKANHFGEVRKFVLPKSFVDVYHSTKYFKRVDDEDDDLTPDFRVEYNFEDFENGLDPAIDKILSL